MDHLCEECGDLAGDVAPQCIRGAFPDPPRSDEHVSPLLFSARVTSSRIASTVSLVGTPSGGRGARLVAATASLSSMWSR